MGSAIRILLVDDNPVFRASAARYLSAQPQLSLLGTAGSGEEALAFIAASAVDLVLLDYHMPGATGIETTRRLKARSGAPKVIVVTLMDLPEYRELAQDAGADGFVAKMVYGGELLPLIARLFPEMPRP